MGFEPSQQRSHPESVNKFKELMDSAPKEAKAALTKSKDDMAKYYDRDVLLLPTTDRGTRSIWMPVTYKPTGF